VPCERIEKAAERVRMREKARALQEIAALELMQEGPIDHG